MRGGDEGESGAWDRRVKTTMPELTTELIDEGDVGARGVARAEGEQSSGARARGRMSLP